MLAAKLVARMTDVEIDGSLDSKEECAHNDAKMQILANEMQDIGQ